jgi:hypothetical protein
VLKETQSGDVVIRTIDADKRVFAVRLVANDGDVEGIDEVIVVGRAAAIAAAIRRSPQGRVLLVDGDQWHEELPRISSLRVPPPKPERRRNNRGVPFGEPHRPELTATILGSYREMPGLSLQLKEAARLFNLRERTCEVVMNDLVGAGHLQRTPDGQYAHP